MKISINFAIEIDPEDWMDAYGIARSQVRADVKEHAKHLVQQAFSGAGISAELVK
ncbi:hypothetical protein BI081_gp198 [Mycobacterium phage Tonenili]|uniref:Uncharacterized protein n=1 Tax=Mycobacterium phage Tonenili TaxID=1891703 RepID=A0A1C9EHE2_9CAUD|nr:hypothetical protein BI081_gp198 [Mycobacterium phage Tonenili]AON96909.1 hypothetical protein SEA_TONENILI_162 [Mycobacterium phage Tonenili]